MQTRNPFIDDLTKVANGAMGALTGMKDEVEARGVDEGLEALAEALPGQAVGLVRVGDVPVFVFCFCSGMEMKEERERERERKKWRERERKVKSFLFGESKFCSLSLSLLFLFSLSHSTPARKA